MERIITKMPSAPYDDSLYSNLKQFDSEVIDHCKSITTAESRFKMDSRMSKIIIVGDVSVGKTSLVQRFVTNSFNHDYKATIGVDFEIEKFQILKTNFNLQIWDTAGQERFKCIAKAYYRGAQAVIITFDTINYASLINAEEWARNALSVVNTNESNPFVFLIGTKFDILDITNFDELKKRTAFLAEKLKAEYWFVSSFDGYNINEFFNRLASLVFNKSIKQELSFTNLKSIGNEAITFKNKKEIHLNKNCKNIEIYNKEMMKIGKSCC